MSILKIYTYPAPILRKKACRVETFDAELQTLVKDMAETMYAAPGIGLAAPQIGKSLQIVVIDTGREEDKQEYMTLINPQFTCQEGNQIDEEGCLSVPELASTVKRYKKVTVTYQDQNGKPCEITAENRLAVVLQHEIDHLDGILFLDHLSPLKRNMYKKKMKKYHSVQAK